MNTADKINYELRPAKYVERRLILISLERIIGYFKSTIGANYSYIGFGALAFTDFKLFHRELGIKKMTSIEGGNYSSERLELNKPYSCISIKRGSANEILPQLDFNNQTIVWLDYDEHLQHYFFDDIHTCISKMNIGSILLVTCNTALQKGTKRDRQPLTDEEFKEEYKELVPIDVGEHCCTASKSATTIWKMFYSYCKDELNARNRVNHNDLDPLPLYNFVYKDGVEMVTFGCVIVKKGTHFEDLNLPNNNFYGANQCRIEFPNLTYREAMRLNQILDNPKLEKKLYIDTGILTQEDLDNYKKFYKYMPNYFDVRL